MNRRRIVHAGIIVLALILGTGCIPGPEHQYLRDTTSGATLQLPLEWVVLDGGEVLAVAAERVPEFDNAAVSRWIHGFTAGQDVRAADLLTPTAGVPGGVIRSRYLLNSEVVHGPASNISVRALLDQLNDLAMIQPGPEIVDRRSEGVTMAGANGVSYELTLRYPSGDLKLRYVAVADVARGFVTTLLVGCTASCYAAYQDEIAQIVESFTVVELQKAPQRRWFW